MIPQTKLSSVSYTNGPNELPQGVGSTLEHALLHPSHQLRELEMDCTGSFLNLLTQSFQSNCQLKKLKLRAHPAQDFDSLAKLFTAMKDASSLELFSLCMTNSGLNKECANSFLNFVRYSTSLTQVTCVTFKTKAPVGLVDIAEALHQNQALTQCRIELGQKHRRKSVFLCDLYTKRNKCRQVLSHPLTTPGLYPKMLESMIPNHSAMFLALRMMVPKLKGNQAFADSSDDLPSPVRKIQKLH
jgi:hypothetical protein